MHRLNNDSVDGYVLRRRWLTRVLVLATLLGCTAYAPPAPALSISVGPTTTVAPTSALTSNAAYSFGTYRTGGNESVTAWSITFPVGTVVSGAYLPGAAVSVNGRTVTVQPASAIPPKTTFVASVEGITNPAAGTYNVGTITFRTVDKQGRVGTATATTGDYTITPAASYLALTITTPDAGQSVEFGTIDPDATAGPKVVILEVNSSAPYTVTRTMSGSSDELGLSISGSVATGVHPAGFATYQDRYSLSPSYSATPEVPLTANVLYTVVQQ